MGGFVNLCERFVKALLVFLYTEFVGTRSVTTHLSLSMRFLFQSLSPGPARAVRHIMGATTGLGPQALGSHICSSYPRVAMIHDNAPHRIFKISELTRLVASQLVVISQESTVHLACACRYLEEPVLSTLWGSQWSLSTLLKVFPDAIWESESPRGECLVRGLRISC